MTVQTTRTILAASLAALATACSGAAAPPPEALPALAAAPMEAAVAEALNAARRDPAAYAERLRALRGRFVGRRLERPGEVALVTEEGVAAVDEAIAFLEAQPPLPALTPSPLLARAAAAHAADQGGSGAVGHVGGDGSSAADRLRRQGRWTATGEAIAYGPTHAEAVVAQLIIDDGVPDRGHRRILFSPAYSLVGVACGPHPQWRTVCVLDFARP